MKDYKTYDVIVIGGGSAGVAAAVAASSEGARVALVERAPALGGKATAAYVGTVCGAYYRSEQHVGNYIVDGFPKEFMTQLETESGSKPIGYKRGLQFLPYDHFVFETLCDQYIKGYNIDLFLQTNVFNVELKNGQINAAHVTAYNDQIRLHGKSFIDCTGDAFLGSLLGLKLIESDKYQAASKVFCIEGIKEIETDNIRLLIFKAIKKAVNSNQLLKEFTQISIVPGSHKNNRIFLKIGIPIEINNQINRMTEVNLLARKLIDNISNLLFEELDCFQDAHLGMVSSEVGIRTGKRHIGQYVLTKNDVMTCAKDKHGVARGAWPIEYWDLGSSPRMEYFAENDYYDIPAGCLISDQIENLFFAGRNISAEDEAIASARVIGTCLQTGYAAGVLGAGFAQKKSQEESIEKIKNSFMI